MDLAWVAVGLDDVTWIALAFALGLLSRMLGLPPLVGYLAAGFLLNVQGVESDVFIEKLSDLGVTLLLFTVGLKIDLSTLTRPHVWAVTGLHMSIVSVAFGLGLVALTMAGVSMFTDLNLQSSLLIAFALSFSSTVFAVKTLEERGQMSSLHGQIAIGILIVQDIAAVVFLAASEGSVPSLYALLLLLLIPLRSVLHVVLQRVGHGELLVLYGFFLALGGAEVFELLQMKGDLGALVLGVLIATHPKADEMAKRMLEFKDLFLIGFFVSIGLTGHLSAEALLIGAILAPLALLKWALFFLLLTRFRLRARTSLLTSLNLANYSEFGLIVTAVGVGSGWLDPGWLVVISIALSLSFAMAAVLNSLSNEIHSRYRHLWRRWQTEQRLPDDHLLDVSGANVAIVGMGGVGTGAYDVLDDKNDNLLFGVDINAATARNQRATGRNVLVGDPSDADFWDRVHEPHKLELVLLALPKASTSLEVLKRLTEISFTGYVAAVARFPDEAQALKDAGAKTVYNLYNEAGAGFAAHVDAARDRRRAQP